MPDVRVNREPPVIPMFEGASVNWPGHSSAYARGGLLVGVGGTAVLNIPSATRPPAMSEPPEDLDWAAHWLPEDASEAGWDTFQRPPDEGHVTQLRARVERESVSPPEWEF